MANASQDAPEAAVEVPAPRPARLNLQYPAVGETPLVLQALPLERPDVSTGFRFSLVPSCLP